MNGILDGKKIVLGITGSIAAYKAVVLARELIKRGAEVQTVITPAGKEFVTMLTLATLTRRPVISEFFSHRDGTWNSHVELGQWADAMLIAPATASTIAKMANGVADNMLVTTYLSMKAPVFVAPAMDLDMYAHPSTQHNIELLRSYGNHIIEPGTGELASALVGKGRMEEPDNIVKLLEAHFAKAQSLTGKKVLVTAGPTYERLDPVRFIGNYSSGKMGFALAEECAARGAQVVLVSGPVSMQVHSPNIRRVDVESAEEMYEAAMSAFADMDAAILCAAVADYKVEHCEANKIKNGQLLVGFALETDNEAVNAEKKLKGKNLDFIVLNSLRDKGAGFKTDTNKITIIGSKGTEAYPLKTKREVAADIVDMLESYMHDKE